MPHADTSCIIIIIIIVVKTLSEVVFWQEQGEELKESYEDPLSPCKTLTKCSGADLGGGCRGCAPLPPEMTWGFLIQLVFGKKKKTMWFIGVEVEQETSAPLPKKNRGSAPDVAGVMKSHPFNDDPE